MSTILLSGCSELINLLDEVAPGADQMIDEIAPDAQEFIEELAPEVLHLIDQLTPEMLEVFNNTREIIQEQGGSADEISKRMQIIQRATIWVTENVKYNQKGYQDGYRTDCSGFVSYAWELRTSAGENLSPTTSKLGEYAREINFDELKSGDVINNKGIDNYGHAVIFLFWLDDNHAKFASYEQNGNPDGNENTNDGRAKLSTYTITTLGNGSMTIREIESFAPGPYYAQRLNTLP